MDPHGRAASAPCEEDDRGYGELGTVGAIDAALHRIQDEGDLLATIAQLRAAHAAGDPIQFMDRTFWTQGVLHVPGLEAAKLPRDRSIDANPTPQQDHEPDALWRAEAGIPLPDKRTPE